VETPESFRRTKTLLDELKQATPTVVLGDFNSSPRGKVLGLFADWSIPDKGKDQSSLSTFAPLVS